MGAAWILCLLFLLVLNFLRHVDVEGAFEMWERGLCELLCVPT